MSWNFQEKTKLPIKLLIDDTYSLLIEPATDYELLIEDYIRVTDWTFQTKN